MSERMKCARAVVVGALACCGVLSRAFAADENTGSRSDAIVGNQLVIASEREKLGLITLVSNRGGCSGSLLSNQWVITASHCLNVTDIRNPGGVNVTADWLDAQHGSPDYIYRFWGNDVAGSNNDVALLHMRFPFIVQGKVGGYKREITDFSIHEMFQKEVAAYGAGKNKYAKFVNNMPVASSSDDKYRVALFKVNRTEAPNWFWYPTNEAGEGIMSGDSGGPSFENTQGYWRIAGVHSACHTTCLQGMACTDSDPWTWVSGMQECADAPLGPIAGALQALMRQQWDPALPIQVFDIPHSESAVRKEMLLGTMTNLPWDYVRRAAQHSCINRGFVSGFYDGNAETGVRYQLRCVSEMAGRWYDAGPADMARIPDKFAGVAQIHWAQGARAAHDICRNADSNSVGGFLTGFEAVPIAGFPDRKDGVFCVNSAYGTFFDATQGELTAQGTPIGNIDFTRWDVGGRAANEYCRRKHYPKGGFFNGHAFLDKRGVICLGKNSLVTDRASATGNTDTLKRQLEEAQGSTSATTSGAARSALPRLTGTTAEARSYGGVLGGAQPAAPIISPAPLATSFYSIDTRGTLLRYANRLPESGSVPNKSVAAVGGWQKYNAVIPAGGNHFYARTTNGDLLWFQHNPDDPANAWQGPVPVGQGWGAFKQIVGGGNGVVYAIAPDGAIVWYRHAGFATGDPRGWSGPKKLADGWGNFKAIFSSGEGVIYTVTQDNHLMINRHLDPLNGAATWARPVQVGNGWGAFAQLFSTGNGVIYGLSTDGKLAYYRHLTWNAATPTFKWVGPVPAGEGFDPTTKLVPVIP